MCETVRYYDHWVNGANLRLVELAAARMPRCAPAPCADEVHGLELRSIELEPYGDLQPNLPELDATALAPISHVLVHGSAATQDTCAFSDVDIAVFVDDRTPYTAHEHRAAVLQLRRLLHAVFAHDPLMHHGLMVAPVRSLENYDQQFLPLDTLARARVLHGPRTLHVRMRQPQRTAATESLRAASRSLRRYLETRAFLRDDYLFKRFLAGALLLPARVLAAQNLHVYKKESFALAQPLFKADEWEFVARCEALRSLWKRPAAPLAHRFLSGRAHPHVRRVIGERLAPKLNVLRLSDAMADGLIASAHRFLNRVEAA